MRPTDEEFCGDDLEARLRRDAARWDAGLDEVVGERVQASLRSLPSRSPWRAVAVAAALFAAPFAWWTWPTAAIVEPVPSQLPVLVDRAIEPLQCELVALTDDASALAARLWDGVPSPVRRWLGE